MSGVLDKIRNLKQRREREGRGRFGRISGIFHNWSEGPNIIRLVDGDHFLEVKTHFVAPSPQRGDRGLCQPDAPLTAACPAVMPCIGRSDK